MKKTKTVKDYINASELWDAELRALREILLSTDLTETIKWGAPCYTYNGQNVVGMMAFKHYFGLWFHQGVLLKDGVGVLMNAQEGKTKALRQWRMGAKDEIQSELIKDYVDEAVALAKAGQKIPVSRNKPVIIPPELEAAMSKDPSAKTAFDKMTPGRRRDYADYISAAKKDATKQRRLTKILPMIKAGGGLNDKYK